MRLRVLGGLELTTVAGEPAPGVTRQTRLLLACLALAGTKGLTRTELCTLFWPDRPSAHARNSLRQGLAAVRRAFRKHPSALSVQSDQEVITMPVAAEAVDVHLFRQKLHEGERNGLISAADVFRADLLAGVEAPEDVEQFISAHRRALNEQARALVERLSMASDGDEESLSAAKALADRLLQSDPASEEAHRALIRTHLRRGRSNSALRQFERCKEALRQELQSEPDADTRQLVDAIGVSGRGGGQEQELRIIAPERSARIERRLSAILAADVAGYSRLMHRDEEATHAKLTALLASAVQPAVVAHSGRIVKNTGDGLLAEFASAVDAVRAAARFQAQVKQRAILEADDEHISFRVGINIGDVIVEPHDIFGDGVNIAAKLQSIAEPGGICISSSAHEQVQGKVQIDFIDIGEQHLKNIDRPIRAYATVLHQSHSSAVGRRRDSFSPPRLSIVVLPFANIGGSAEQDYFADGVTESLTTDLSRIRGSFVIGRHTAFTYKNSAIDLKQIGRELNVRYVLEGSVQYSNDRIRVNAQLIDAETGNHLWAERFDKPKTELFDMQDEIVSRLAHQLETQLTEAEARRFERSPHPNSMELYFQGKPCCIAAGRPRHWRRPGKFLSDRWVSITTMSTR